MRVIKILYIILLLLCTSLLQSFTAENPVLEEAISYYRQENYDEAIAALKKARKEDPTSTLAAYYLGLAYKQIQDYKEAKSHLKDAVTYTPKIKGALLELVEVLYQLGELEEAHRYIDIAEKEDIRPAQTAFLKGLVLSKEERNLEAMEAFEKAKGLDASLEQTADYQIGLLYLKEKRFKEAKEVFGEVVIADPNSDVALFANQYMEAISIKEEAERPFRFTAGTAFQYDDNVILRPSDATVAAEIAGEEDTREVFTFKSEYTGRITEQLRLKMQYSLYWALQNDLSSYEVFSNSVSVAPSYYFEKASLSASLGYNHTMVNDRGYLSTFNVTPLANFMLGDACMAQLFFKYQNKEFLQSPVNDDEDRDANNYAGGTGMFWFFADKKGFLNLRYEISKDDTEGSNWEYIGNKFGATLLVPLHEKFKVTAFGEVFLQDFENDHTVYRRERDDDQYTAGCMLAYNLFKDTEIQLRYTYINNDSNIAVYDYDRNIYSGGVEYKF